MADTQSDGNKRIAGTMFLYFLDKNNALFVEGSKRIADFTLVALTIMIAESKPEEKEMIVNVIMNCLTRHAWKEIEKRLLDSKFRSTYPPRTQAVSRLSEILRALLVDSFEISVLYHKA